jgi:hypothetical protein
VRPVLDPPVAPNQPRNVAAPARWRGTPVIKYCTSTVTSPPAATVRSGRPT